jgi:hypothetical protein
MKLEEEQIKMLSVVSSEREGGRGGGGGGQIDSESERVCLRVGRGERERC